MSSIRRLPSRFTTPGAKIPEPLEHSNGVIPPTGENVKTPNRGVIKVLRDKAKKLKKKQMWADCMTVLQGRWGDDEAVDEEDSHDLLDPFPEANAPLLLSDDAATTFDDSSDAFGLSEEEDTATRGGIFPPLLADGKTSSAAETTTEHAAPPSYADIVKSDDKTPHSNAAHHAFRNARNVDVLSSQLNHVARDQSVSNGAQIVNNLNVGVDRCEGKNITINAQFGMGSDTTPPSSYSGGVLQRVLHYVTPILVTGLLVNGATNALRMVLDRRYVDASTVCGEAIKIPLLG